MPRRFFKRILPDHARVREHKALQFFGTLLHDPNLWHLNRRSAAGAFAIGLFMAFVPIPFQMAAAAALAILFRVNLPIAVALVWITNPLTMPPIFYSLYKLGAWVLDTPPMLFHFELSWDWLVTDMRHIWKPFLLGCLIMSTTSAIAGYVAIRVIWRISIVLRMKERRLARLARDARNGDDSAAP